MTKLLGHVVRKAGSENAPGLRGTVVHANPTQSVRLWQQDFTWDVIWEDGSCSRRLAESDIREAGWDIQPTRVPESECTRLWLNFQLNAARARGAAGAARAVRETADMTADMTAVAAAPARAARASAASTAPTVPTAPARAAAPMTQQEMEQALMPKRVPDGRALGIEAKELLRRRLPEEVFAVSCERKVLTVAWLDGPSEVRVFRELAALKSGGLVQKVLTRRSTSEVYVQAAINYALHRTFAGKSTPESSFAEQRISTSEYLNGGMTGFMPPAWSVTGSTTYKELIRCVLERWDGHSGSFADTRRTHFMVAEKQALFPQGDKAAAIEFSQFIADVREASERAGEAVGNIQIARERQ